MISGLHIQIPVADLAAHLEARQDFHRIKAEWYAQQVKNLAEVPATGASNDPKQSLQASANEHQQKADFFGLLRKYLIPDEVYRLDTSDLAKLELVSRWF